MPGTQLAEAIGERSDVACHHHQSVREHPGFVVSARASDGTLEAMESPDRPFWLAVQWHPETRADAGLFRSLVEAAQSR
jgi:putative glutamine amidotransferase